MEDTADESLSNRQNNLVLLLPDIKIEEDHPEFVNDNDLPIQNTEREDNRENDVEQDDNAKSTFTENFNCGRCGEEFPSLKYVQVHEAIHDSKLLCPACDRIFKTERYFIQHIQTHLKRPLVCQHCPEIFFDKRSYNLHLFCHRENKRYTCEYCFKEWSNKKDLQIHIRVHTNERPYSCEACGKAFKQRGGLRYHVDSVHALDKKDVIKERFTCEICNGSYASVSSLNKHVRRIHEMGKTFPCRKCGESFLNFLQMKQHKLEAHPELVYHRFCPLCNKEFFCRESYIKHQNSHAKSDESHYSAAIGCCLCGEQVNGKKAFSKHQQIHLLMTDDEFEECIRTKQFICKVCGRHFTLKKHLYRHMDVHLEKTFECNTHCTEKFTYLGMQVHFEWHFDQFHCNECNETFIGRKNLKEHYKVHPKRDMLTCKICGHKFRYKQLLMAHWNIHHNLKCHVCPKKFLTHLALKRHIKIKHSVYSESTVRANKALSENKYADTTVPNYKCKMCKRVFNTKKQMQNHMKSHKRKCFQCENCKKNFLYFRNMMFHVRENICLKYYDDKRDMKRFHCVLCKKEYKTLERLASHTRIHTTIYKCKFCNSRFKHKDLQEHIKRVHPGKAMYLCDKCPLHFSSLDDFVKHTKCFHKEVLFKSELEDSVTVQAPEEVSEVKTEVSEDIELHDIDPTWIKKEPEY